MKTKIKLLNACNLIIAGLCALLGLASCTTSGPDEYGTPSAKFIVNGKVLSEKTQQSLKNIRVIMQENSDYLPFTLRCNLNCLHCGSDCKKDATVKDMPSADFLKAIDQLSAIINTGLKTLRPKTMFIKY